MAQAILVLVPGGHSALGWRAGVMPGRLWTRKNEYFGAEPARWVLRAVGHDGSVGSMVAETVSSEICKCQLHQT